MKKTILYLSSCIMLVLFFFLVTIVSARQNEGVENPTGTLDNFVFLPITIKPTVPQPKIVFASSNDIYIVNADGTDLRNLTNTSDISEMSPIWSPDGTKIAYNVKSDPHGGDYGDIFTMDADGTNQINVSHALEWHNTEVAWSSNSQQLAFISNRNNYDGGYDLFVVNSDGTGLKNVTNSTYPETQNRNPHWSPDGTQIVFSEGRYLGPFVNPSHHYLIMKINSDGTNKTELFDNSYGSNFFPKWFPDGSKISFIKSDPNPDCLWIMNPDGTSGSCAVNYSELHFAHKFQWNTSGSQQLLIGYDLFDTSWAYLHIFDIGTQAMQKLEQQCSAFSSFAWSPDESQAVCEGPGSHIFVINSDESDVFNLTESLSMNGTDPDWSSVPIH